MNAPELLENYSLLTEIRKQLMQMALKVVKNKKISYV